MIHPPKGTLQRVYRENGYWTALFFLLFSFIEYTLYGGDW